MTDSLEDLFNTQAVVKPEVEPEPPATERQMNFIHSLQEERGIEPGGKFTKREASKEIDRLLAIPKLPKAPVITGGKEEFTTVFGEVPKQGTFTVVFENGDRRTIRFHSPRYGRYQGKTLVKYLGGRDNENDYIAFGNSTGKGIRIWFRYRDNQLLKEAVEVILSGDQKKREEAGERFAIESSNCYRCGRTLTVPASIYRGLGPDCAALVEGGGGWF